MQIKVTIESRHYDARARRIVAISTRGSRSNDRKYEILKNCSSKKKRGRNRAVEVNRRQRREEVVGLLSGCDSQKKLFVAGLKVREQVQGLEGGVLK